MSDPDVLFTDFSEFVGGKGLFIGNSVSGEDTFMQKKFKYKMIIDFSGNGKYYVGEGINHVRYDGIKDKPDEDISLFFNETFDLIESVKDGGVLVHCSLGKSRSGTIVLNYVMRKNRWSLRKTMKKCCNKHRILKPNKGFIRLLMAYEKKYVEEGILEDTKLYTIEEYEEYEKGYFKEKCKKKYSSGITC